MSGAVFRGINLKLPAGAFREAIKRESPRRTRDGQPADPTGPVQRVPYGSDDYAAALGEQPVLITPDGEVRILPPGATPIEHPDTQGVVGDWDRDGIVRRFVGRKDWSAAVKPSAAEAAEWDHVQLSLSRQEGEQATPEQVKVAVALLVEVLRTPPLRFTRDGDPETFQRWLADKRITRGDVLGIDGARMIHVLPVHDNTDNVHVQVFVHRHPVDVNKHEVGAAIKQHEPVVSRAQVAALNALFEANGLPFRVTNAFERVNAGQGATLDTEQAAEVVKAIEEAGGTAPARLTTGQQGQLAGVIAVPSVTPEAQRIAASIDEDAQALARMKAEMDALAARIAAKQHAVAAIQEAAAARAAQVEAEALAAQRAEELAAAQVEAERLAGDLARETELAMQQGERADQAERRAEAAEALAAERYATVEDLTGKLAEAEAHAAEEPERQAAAVEEAVRPVREALEAAQRHAEGEPARQAEAVSVAVSAAVEPLRGELAELRAALDAERQAREAAIAELAEERRTFVERAREWAETNVTGPLVARAEAAEATLKAAREEIAAFPARMEAELDRRVAAMEARLQAGFDRMMAAAEARFNAALEAKDRVIDGLRAAAAAPVQAVSQATGELAQRVEGAQRTRQPRAGADFATVPPDQWTDAQRSYAQRALAHYIKEGTLAEGTSLEDFGRKAHADWQEKNQPQPGPQQPGTPRRPK